MKATKKIIELAAACGIDARNLTVSQVRERHASTKGAFVDQHDMRLTEALDELEAAYARTVERLAGELKGKMRG